MNKYYSKNNHCKCEKLILNISKQCRACMGISRKGENNLINLCHKCDIKVNKNRSYWTEYFKEKVRWQTVKIPSKAI